jgi:hypothetical protein
MNGPYKLQFLDLNSSPLTRIPATPMRSMPPPPPVLLSELIVLLGGGMDAKGSGATPRFLRFSEYFAWNHCCSSFIERVRFSYCGRITFVFNVFFPSQLVLAQVHSVEGFL